MELADPQKVIQELQGMEVLAQADHEVIEGGTFSLEPEEWEEISRFVRDPQRQEQLMAWLPQSVENRIAHSAQRTRRILEAYETHIEPDWPTLIFATSVEHAQTLAALLNRQEITARAVSGTTEPATRRRVVEGFRDGEIRALVNYGVFREGFDAPKTRAIIVARPVGAGNSAVVVDLPRCGPILGSCVPNLVSIPGVTGSADCAVRPLEGS